jgi:hypothetical protein
MPTRITILFTALTLFPSTASAGDWVKRPSGSCPTCANGQCDQAAAPAGMLQRLFRGGGATVQTPNFTVTAPTQQDAEIIGQWAEKYRRDLALVWLGQELPAAGYRHPIQVKFTANNNSGGGATSFAFDRGQILRSQTEVEGPPQRVQASVLRHELNHLVWAHCFGAPVPRWLDEGAAECAEDDVNFQHREQDVTAILNRKLPWIPLRQLVTLPDYPQPGPNGQNITSFYAESFGVVNYLLDQKDPATLVQFVAAGMQGQTWDQALTQFYGIHSVDQLEQDWVAACWRKRQGQTGGGLLGGLLGRGQQQTNPAAPPGPPSAPPAGGGGVPTGGLQPPGPNAPKQPTVPRPALTGPATSALLQAKAEYDKRLADQDKRIAALEARPAPAKGEKGDTGPKGDKGDAGASGKAPDPSAVASQVAALVQPQLTALLDQRDQKLLAQMNAQQAILYDAQGNVKQAPVTFGPNVPLKLKLVPVTPATQTPGS